MLILSDYMLSCKVDSDFCVESRDTCPCPDCQSPLVHRDFKLHVMKLEGGEKKSLRIERMRCTNHVCGLIHNALPDYLASYRHYASEVIAGVLGEVISPG